MATLLNLVAPAAALGAAEYAVELFREQMLVRKVKNTVDNRQADSRWRRRATRRPTGWWPPPGCTGRKPSALFRLACRLRR